MKKILLLFLSLSIFLLSVKAQGPTEIWGITRRGGNSFGCIFKTDQNGNNPLVAHTFDGKISAKYSFVQFQEAENGKLYATMNGGIYDDGIIIELDPATGKIEDKAHFNSLINGDSPKGMTLGPNGKFYGTLRNFVDNKKESIFEYDIVSNTITKKAEFPASIDKSLVSGMVLAKNSKLYGTTTVGGNYDEGMLYEYDIATNSIIRKINFQTTKMGGYPGKVNVELNNKLYGCTLTGGINGGGTIYEYDIASNQLSVKYKMDKVSCAEGLTLGNDGLLYGATGVVPPTPEPGVFFKFDPANSTFTIIQQFDYKTTGVNPYGVKKCKNGLLYGALADGGIYGAGSIYKYDPVSSKFTVAFNFKDTLSGLSPYTMLEQAKNGKLYGGAYIGGKYDNGALFEFDITYHTYKKLRDLGDGLNGNDPFASLSLADNGKIYTVTEIGGKYNCGILLECDPSTQPGIFTKKFDFNITSGAFPTFAPVQGPDGKLYGTTPSGGKELYDEGVLYEFDPVTNSMVTKVCFSDSAIKSYKPSGLTLASNKKFYGVALGGKNDKGVLFEFDPTTGSYSECVDLIKISNSFMIGELLQAKNGKLYGLLKSSFPGNGFLFEYTLGSDTIVVKAERENTAVYTESSGKMIEAANGKLYGIITPAARDKAYLFEYDPATGILTNRFTFSDPLKGKFPLGSLLAASNGNLYGMTERGGSDNRGTLFEYNYKDNIYSKKFDFTGPLGMTPRDNNNLIEVCKSIPYQGSVLDSIICENQYLKLSTGLSPGNYTFQWYKNEMLIPSASSDTLSIPSVKESDAGIYFCKVSNGCRTIQTKNAIIKVLSSSDPDCGVGINEQKKIAFEIYPNPAADEFQIRFDHPTRNRMTIELIDVLGQSVLQENIILSAKSATFSIDHLQSGIYIVSVRDANSIFENRKLIKY